MPDIPLDKASLVSLWLETLLYGAYAVLFCICVFILVFRSRTGKVNHILLTTTIAMFCLSTMHVSVGLRRGILAFIDSKDSPDGAIGYYSEISNWLSIFKQALYATNNIIADSVVVYRCYVVWGYNVWICVAPAIMLLATSVCGYAAVFNFSQVKPGQDVFAKNIAEWGTGLFSLSLATNVTVTTLIATRIWWISRRMSDSLGRQHAAKYHAAVAIILESGAIYSVSLMTLLILYVRQTNAQYIVYDALAQITGIVPTLIVVRVGLGLTTQQTTQASSVRFKLSKHLKFRSHPQSSGSFDSRDIAPTGTQISMDESMQDTFRDGDVEMIKKAEHVSMYAPEDN